MAKKTTLARSHLSFSSFKALFKSPLDEKAVTEDITHEEGNSSSELTCSTNHVSQTCDIHGQKIRGNNLCRACVDEMYEPSRRVIDAIVEDIESALNHVDSHNEIHIKQCAQIDGRKKPSVSLNSYIYRLVRYMDSWYKLKPPMSAGMRSLIISLIYISRIQKMVSGFQLNDFNVHRLFMVTMLIAAKFSEDKPISNAFWSKVGGLNLDKLNKIEQKVCSLTDFNLNVTDAEYDQKFAEYT